MLCLKIISNSYGSNADGMALSNLKLLPSTKKDSWWLRQTKHQNPRHTTDAWRRELHYNEDL